MSRMRWSARLALTAVVVAGLSGAPAMGATVPASAAQAHTGHETDASHETGAGHGAASSIPVAGMFAYRDGQQPGSGIDHGAVHAVVRIPHGTAVFYSIGGAASPGGVGPGAGLSQQYGPYDVWSVGLIDAAGRKYYQPMDDASGHCLCSRTDDVAGFQDDAPPKVGWAIMAPLPAVVTHVGVVVGFGAPVADVPVTDALPAPTVAASAAKLGAGWPKLPSVASVPEKNRALSVRSLVRTVADPDATTHDGASDELVELKADVLFAYDKATLTSKAHDALVSVAGRIDKSATGTVEIVGYTDSTGDSAHNETLSKARADAVLSALKPLVHASGVTLKATGEGEEDPVADNSTAAGRKLNRRVAVRFAKERS